MEVLRTAELQAVGAGAVNQAVKAIAICRGYVASNGVNLVTIPAFTDIYIDGVLRTAIRFIVNPR
ncbi:MAG: Stage V sporulation protein S [Firmicutes bacterium]|nr:Stage V sporulation protein S [Bacillota bacterium]